MFRLAPVPTFKRTVTVRVPDPDIVDKLNDQKLTLSYRVLTNEEVRAFDAARSELSYEERMKDPNAFLKHVITGWGDDVVDASGAPVPFTPEALSQALEYPWFATAAMDEYRRGLNGEPRLGN